MFYAEIVVREWGEEDRPKVIGPFDVESEDELDLNLRERGDEPVRIWSE